MAEITKEQFKVVGKNTKTMESISRPNIGYWQDAWRRIRKNKIAFFSLCLIGLYVLMAIFVPIFRKYDSATMRVSEMKHQIIIELMFCRNCSVNPDKRINGELADSRLRAD